MGSAAAGSTAGYHEPRNRRDSRRRSDCDAHARRGSCAAVSGSRAVGGHGKRAADSSGGCDGGRNSCRAGRGSSCASVVGQWRGAKRSRTGCERGAYV